MKSAVGYLEYGFPVFRFFKIKQVWEFKKVISSTFSDMQLNYIICIICGNVRPLILPRVWV